MKRITSISAVCIIAATLFAFSATEKINMEIISDSGETSQKTGDSDNPFFTQSVLPFEAPDFDAITNEHYMPAFEAGMAQQLQEIEAIAGNPDAPTFENTIVTMEYSGEILTRVQRVFFNMTSAHTNSEIQRIQSELSPKLAAHSDKIYLNNLLFERVNTLYEDKENLGLDPESKELLRTYHERFVRAGALLSETEQQRVREINERLSSLGTQFQENLLEITRERAVIVDTKDELDGLSDSRIAALKEAAEDRGHEGKYLISITNTTRQPILTSLNNRGLRQRVWEASAYRGLGKDDGIDNREIVLEIASLRAERAQILGYEHFAEFALEPQTAESVDQVYEMLSGMVPDLNTMVRVQADEIRELMAEYGEDHEIEPWDWEFYAEKLRQRKFEVDENEVRPYFELERVLDDGVFYTMERLFGITFEERHDLPVYHPDVRVWNVYEENGDQIGLFYGDFFARDSKRGGAWMSSFVGQSHLLDQKPVVVNVLNIPKPASGEPALVSLSNVMTLFHEMGHGVHGLFSDVTYPSLAGTSVPRDYVEFPSTFMEDWAIQPELLERYARHYETGEPIPMELVEGLLEAERYNQAFDTFEYLSATFLDMEWHLLSPDEIPAEVESFEDYAISKHDMDYRPVPPRYKTAFFAHVWPGGYASSYYAYIWSEILAADAFSHMMQLGGLTRENGRKFRDTILSRGGSKDPLDLYRDFKGAEPEVEALLRRRGLLMD